MKKWVLFYDDFGRTRILRWKGDIVWFYTEEDARIFLAFGSRLRKKMGVNWDALTPVNMKCKGSKINMTGKVPIDCGCVTQIVQEKDCCSWIVDRGFDERG